MRKHLGGMNTARSPGIASPRIENIETEGSLKGILKKPQKSPSHVRFESNSNNSDTNPISHNLVIENEI